MNLFAALTLSVANSRALYDDAHSVALDVAPLIQLSLKSPESVVSAESADPPTGSAEPEEPESERAAPKESAPLDPKKPVEPSTPVELVQPTEPVLPVKHTKRGKHPKHKKHKKKHAKRSGTALPSNQTQEAKWAQLAHSAAKSERQLIAGSNLFDLLGRGLVGFAPGQQQLSTVFVSFAEMLHENGTTVELDYPEELGNCSYVYALNESVRFTNCVFSLTNQTEVPLPAVKFNMTKAESSMATFVGHVTIGTYRNKTQHNLHKFNIACNRCGDVPCMFKMLTRDVSWEVPRCPLPKLYSVPLDLWSIQHAAPRGTVLDLGAQDFRAGTWTLGYLVRIQV